jgi:nicotinamidase-related amidase
MADLAIAPERTALINIDLQKCFVDSAPDGLALLDSINELAVACREAGILVIHTRHVLRPDGSNIGLLRDIPAIRDALLNEDAGSAALHEALVLDERDIVLDKPRFGAFYGTHLAEILGSRGIDTVIISGISTPVCCYTTAREAHARDLRVLLLSDGTATAGPDAERFQKAALDVLDGLFAQVHALDGVLQKIRRRPVDGAPRRSPIGTHSDTGTHAGYSRGSDD